MMLPRMLLHRKPGGGPIPKRQLVDRFEKINSGQWATLIHQSRVCDERAAAARTRGNRRRGTDLESRAARAEMLVHMSELSSARQALEGAAIAPGTQATLDALRDPARRPPQPRFPLSHELTNYEPTGKFDLDQDQFCRNLRSSRRGAAGGPSGMTTEHLRCVLEDLRATHFLSELASRVAAAQIPRSVTQLLRLGQMTALAKPDGGVRGIVVGDVMRRWVARTMSQQLMGAVERATAPHQYALTTKAGCECIAHALQGITEFYPEATVTSIDVVSAYDLISREAMLRGITRVDGKAHPFVRMFYGSPSEYLWEDEVGVVHRVSQGEGGEQGDAMMPLLVSLGQHEALQATHDQLQEGEYLFAFLDDIYLVTSPERTGPVYAILEEALRAHACIQVHIGKTKVWNRAGVRPDVCDVLERIAQVADPTATVWKGGGLPSSQQGIKVLGTPLGHEDFDRAHLQRITEKHRTLLERIPAIQDIQSAWLLLLHCASARACYHLRAVSASAVAEFADTHDQDMWRCLSTVLQTDLSHCPEAVRTSATPSSRPRRPGTQECPQDAGGCILGELVRRPPNDLCKASPSGHGIRLQSGGEPQHTSVGRCSTGSKESHGNQRIRPTFMDGNGQRCPP